jgi:NADH dehydrogenase
MATRPQVIVIGAGFGGLFVARELAKKPVDVLIIDRNNYHTFTPLIYQVATCALDPSEVAYPVRSIFYKKDNIRFLLGDVTAIDATTRQVTIMSEGKSRQERYDYLVLAGGSVPTYFGNDDFQQHAFELRTLSDAVDLRNHILRLFERAVWTNDFAERDRLTTIVVVGGGPTGLETAGAIYELYNYMLKKEYRRANLRARVILVEMSPHLLSPYPEKLRQAALKQLQSLGVEVMLEHRVAAVTADDVILGDGSKIATHTLIWAAGVKASPLGELLGVELKRSGHVPIDETTKVKDLERVYVIGDMAYLEDANGNPYPMMIPVAQQQAKLAAKNILHDIKGETPQSFTYQDKGIMATIGRRRAVAWLYNKVQLSGFIAWMVWLVFHLMTLLGFRNRASVFMSWVWNYFTYDRSVRIILEKSMPDGMKGKP